MPIQLRDYQLEAVNKLHNGNILCGGVGSGKSRTTLAYYFKECVVGLGKQILLSSTPGNTWSDYIPVFISIRLTFQLRRIKNDLYSENIR